MAARRRSATAVATKPPPAPVIVAEPQPVAQLDQIAAGAPINTQLYFAGRPCVPVPPGGPYYCNRILPFERQHYALPGSHWLDPPYAWYPPWPYPRAPQSYETQSRAPGTGLLWGPSTGPCPPQPCPPKPPTCWYPPQSCAPPMLPPPTPKAYLPPPYGRS